MSQSSHDDAVEAFLTAQEPITVEVLRRSSSTAASNSTHAAVGVPGSNPASLTSNSVPVSHRNSTYIPPKSPSGLSLKETSSQTEAAVASNNIILAKYPQNDHDFEEEDELMVGGTEDLLVPGLDYEVNSMFFF